jgi:hypothetical protein
LRARVRDIPAANGKAVPISQQVSNGLRFVYVCRFHACNTTSGAWRPPLSPTPELLLAAVDLHDDSIPRLGLPWQLPLPLDPALRACVPPPAPRGSDLPGNETVVVAGPMLLAGGRAVVFALSCRHGGGNGAGGGAGGGNGSASGVAFLYGVSIDPLPAVLWRSQLTLAPAAAAPAPQLPAPVARALLLDAAPGHRFVWVLPLGSGQLSAVHAANGTLALAPLDLAALVSAAPAAACALASAAPGPGAVEVAGAPLGSPSAAGGGGGAGTLIVFAAAATGPALPPGTPRNWVVAVLTTAGGAARLAPAVAWCMPTPAVNGTALGEQPVRGQITAAQDGNAATVLVFATDTAVHGLSK